MSEDENTRRISGWDQGEFGSQRQVTARVRLPWPRAFVRLLSILSVYKFLMASLYNRCCTTYMNKLLFSVQQLSKKECGFTNPSTWQTLKWYHVQSNGHILYLSLSSVHSSTFLIHFLSFIPPPVCSPPPQGLTYWFGFCSCRLISAF